MNNNYDNRLIFSYVNKFNSGQVLLKVLKTKKLSLKHLHRARSRAEPHREKDNRQQENHDIDTPQPRALLSRALEGMPPALVPDHQGNNARENQNYAKQRIKTKDP